MNKQEKIDACKKSSRLLSEVYGVAESIYDTSDKYRDQTQRFRDHVRSLQEECQEVLNAIEFPDQCQDVF